LDTDGWEAEVAGVVTVEVVGAAGVVTVEVEAVVDVEAVVEVEAVVDDDVDEDPAFDVWADDETAAGVETGAIVLTVGVYGVFEMTVGTVLEVVVVMTVVVTTAGTVGLLSGATGAVPTMHFPDESTSPSLAEQDLQATPVFPYVKA